MRRFNGRQDERGSILLVVVFIATAIAALAAISSGRVVTETKHQKALEDETRAFNGAYAQLHMALNVVNTSPYNSGNQNVAIRDAMAGLYGGTIATSEEAGEAASGGVVWTYDEKGNPKMKKPGGEKSGYAATGQNMQPTGKEDPAQWMDLKTDPVYGFISGTNVRVYRGRDYIKRLQRLRGEIVQDVDPFGDSDAYYVLEAAGRSGETVRLVSALVRENEPFSSFVFFQNRATLGVSGAPRGLIHANKTVAFYFPNGNYVDTVTAAGGFEYMAGAEPENTYLRDANPEAKEISLSEIDFADLKAKADLYVGDDGLDAEVKMYSNGNVRIQPHTPPRYEMVEKTNTYEKLVGTEEVTVKEIQSVKIGEEEVEYDEKVFSHYEYSTYTTTEKVKVGTKTVEYWDTVKVKVGTKQVQKTKQVPVYEQQTVTKYKSVKVWVPYNQGEAGGGTSVGGGAGGELGEWKWVQQPYETQEMVQVGTKTETYYVTENVYENQAVKKTKTENVYEWQEVEKTKKTKIYKWVEKTKMVPIYEDQEVEVTKTVNVYETITETEVVETFQPRTYLDKTYVKLGSDKSGTVYIDGRITRLYGDLQGRLTVVGNETVRISGNIRYVDDEGRTAMENGSDYTKPYERNSEYTGHSVLGVIARDDIRFTRYLPSNAEINGTLMAVNGRVGIDGFWADDEGELHKDSWSNRNKYLTEEQQKIEQAYDKYSAYRTKRFVKDSLRRIGGVISNNRVMETYIKQQSGGYAKVDAGFKRGNMKFDINLLFNPPPNFVEVPRPVVTAFVPIMVVRDNDS